MNQQKTRILVVDEDKAIIHALQRNIAMQGYLVLMTRNEQEVKQTPIEHDLLHVLIKNRGKLMTKRMLLTQVWGTHHQDQAHYLHVYIGQLRRKIEPDPSHPRFLQTIAGVGYRLSEE